MSAEAIATTPARKTSTGGIDAARFGLITCATVACGAVALLLVTIVWLSFLDGAPGEARVAYTLRHYADMLGDAFTWKVLLNTFVFALVTLVVAFLVALPLAFLMERSDFPGKNIVFTLMTVALLIPGFATALGWIFLLHERIGILNKWLVTLLDLEAAPFNVATILGMGVIEGLSLTPVTFIMTSVIVRQMNPALEEAAATSGASTPQIAMRVTLPVMWPGLLATAIYVAALSFAAFDVPATLGLSARIFTFSTYVYREVTPSEGAPAYGHVATLSLVMVALAIMLSVWYRSVQKQAPKYAVITGKAYQPRTVALGLWKWPALAGVTLYFIVSQLLPLLTLVWASGLPFLRQPTTEAFAQLSLAHYRNIPLDLLTTAISNTILLMLAVPTITLALSVAVSWVVLRSRSRFSSLYDFLAFLPVTIPHLVFSLAALLLALFVLRDILPIYGTIWILLIVYVIGRLSYGTRMTNSAFIQLHPELEESAHASGAGTAAVLRRIVLPIISPTLLYAWIWIALLTYRELTLPVMLSTSDTMPFAVLVWGYVQASQYGPASAASLIMLAFMIPFLALYWIIARRAGISTARAP